MIGFDGAIAAVAAVAVVVAVAVPVAAAAAAAGEEGQTAESDLAWEQVFPVRDVFCRAQNDEIAHDHVWPRERNH